MYNLALLSRHWRSLKPRTGWCSLTHQDLSIDNIPTRETLVRLDRLSINRNLIQTYSPIEPNFAISRER
jgi:hypothetical protein